jgi:hypothetical protein
LTITAEHGTVDASPAGPYHYGDQVTLTAAPDTGYHFTEWSGDITGADSTTTITIYGNMSLTAGFVISEYTLTITAENGKVTRAPDLLTYHFGDVVSLVAEPNAGYKFAGWTDNMGGVYPRSLTIYITISGDISITANFDTIMKSYDIPLASGWNYISLPVKPITTDLATVLQSMRQVCRDLGL